MAKGSCEHVGDLGREDSEESYSGGRRWRGRGGRGWRRMGME